MVQADLAGGDALACRRRLFDGGQREAVLSFRRLRGCAMHGMDQAQGYCSPDDDPGGPAFHSYLLGRAFEGQMAAVATGFFRKVNYGRQPSNII